MKKQNLALISCLLFSSLSFAATDTGELKAGATLSELTEQYPVHWVSVEQVIQGLKSAPLNVGFDIDDTLLYSSPGFFMESKNTHQKVMIILISKSSGMK
ncbi:class B acid phosphatase (Minor phosphate-irrepressible acid phosphatase) [Escherichia coli TA464]|nr:class B acid phosphatase (Minor phosphate-irrepressible acid phosphatase) [Escherichia coli TA464]